MRWSQVAEEKWSLNLWKDPETRIVTQDPDTWRTLEGIFLRANNLEEKNGAAYERDLLTRSSEASRWGRLLNYGSWLYWGYGLRPLRLLAWIIVLSAAFTCVYWTQVHPAPGARGWQRWKGVWLAALFSINTAARPFYGFQKARTRFFKALTLVQSLASKAMFACFLIAVGNVSPLAQSLIEKIKTLL